MLQQKAYNLPATALPFWEHLSSAAHPSVRKLPFPAGAGPEAMLDPALVAGPGCPGTASRFQGSSLRSSPQP